jgi:cytochrome c oxidase subunit 2
MASMNSPSWLLPAGPAAAHIAGFTWFVFVLGTVVYLVVIASLAWPLLRRQRSDTEAVDAPTTGGSRLGGWFLGAVAVVTTVIITVLLLVSLRTFAAILPSGGPAPLTIEVVGHQYWWAIRYPGPRSGETFETANEIHIPTGRPVAIRLASADVIHSFWVPQLQGKLDLIPGKTNVTWIQADRPGVYRGQCAEYCGIQHAQMGLLVVAEPPEQFEEWLRGEAAPGRAPTDDVGRRGERLFVDRGCASCHAVRGTLPFFGRGGPDLTHVASRRTLAAATLTNVPGHLAGWVANPQALKPGTRMPLVPLEPEEFHAVLQYLQGLR